MMMKKVNVRQHPRRLPSGRYTTVQRHDRGMETKSSTVTPMRRRASGKPSIVYQKKKPSDAYLEREERKLQQVADKLRVRDDWHEPDEQGVSATVSGKKLDNAYGNSGRSKEYVVGIKKNGKVVHRVNLATLLAIASKNKKK